jgi:3-oxoacyl-[acyl-carrier protein] reductase
MTTVLLGAPDALWTALARGIGATAKDIDSPLPPDVDGVVIIVGADPAPRLNPLADVSVVEWRSGVSDPVWQTVAALQRSFAAMRPRGGRIVLVVPTAGMSGAAGLVPYTTAVEGIRAMAKSAARQWRSDGVVVNLIGVPLRLFAPELSGSTAHLTAAAFEDDDTLIHSVVETAKFLLRADINHLIGDTVVADGGSVMLP